jgi:hypothetical protein
LTFDGCFVNDSRERESTTEAARFTIGGEEIDIANTYREIKKSCEELWIMSGVWSGPTYNLAPTPRV